MRPIPFALLAILLLALPVLSEDASHVFRQEQAIRDAIHEEKEQVIREYY
jgi:Flp pilus assembly protein TadG